MEESYQSRLREREAQLMALQAQINPHFLYNWMAFSIGAREISEMVTALSRYFRLSLNKGNAMVSVRDELGMVRVCLEIQQTRYMGVIRYRFDMEEETEESRIPKLTFQPIVENAVLHGIQMRRWPPP